MAKHSKTRIAQNSPYVGQRCPISHRTFRAGDEVLICEQTKTVFALSAWQQILPSWNYTCQFCETSVDGLGKPSVPFITTDTVSKQQKANPPTYEPSRGSGLRTFSQIVGIAVLLSLVAIVAFGLSRNDSQPSMQSTEDSTRQTPISLTTQPIPQVIATDTILPLPTASPMTEQLISETATLPPFPSHTPLPTLLPTTVRQPTHTSTPTIDQLKTLVSSRVRSSSIYTAYPQPVDNFITSLLRHLPEFQLTSLGITEPIMREVLNRSDIGDRVNGLVQEVWDEWVGVAKNKNFDSMNTDPGNQGLSPLRQLVIRMIQGRQDRLVDSQQHALHNILTRSENSSIWGRDMDSVIGAVNRESFLWP